MAKANLVLSNGTKVEIEGTAEEVAVLLEKCSSPSADKQNKRSSKPKKDHRQASSQGKKKQGPVGYIAELVSENFFKGKRSLPEVQKKLEEKGHIYAQNSLSPALLHHVRKTKMLRRLKEKDVWVYVS
ncbi:MAG: hypothetical protein NT106_09385 [Candidatus Sumerlaeota bacterium]|nr:hypothetical protein [Candidatus Sumerlaeota bacterium]